MRERSFVFAYPFFVSIIGWHYTKQNFNHETNLSMIFNHAEIRPCNGKDKWNVIIFMYRNELSIWLNNLFIINWSLNFIFWLMFWSRRRAQNPLFTTEDCCPNYEESFSNLNKNWHDIKFKLYYSIDVLFSQFYFYFYSTESSYYNLILLMQLWRISYFKKIDMKNYINMFYTVLRL